MKAQGFARSVADLLVNYMSFMNFEEIIEWTELDEIITILIQEVNHLFSDRPSIMNVVHRCALQTQTTLLIVNKFPGTLICFLAPEVRVCNGSLISTLRTRSGRSMHTSLWGMLQ